MNDSSKPTGLGALAQRDILTELAVKRAEATIEDLKETRKLAKEHMQIALAEAGIDSVKYKGFMVFAHESTFASLIKTKAAELGDNEQPNDKAYAAMRENELGWMIKETVSNPTLRAWVLEQEEDKDTKMPKLPEGLKDHIKVSKKQDIRIKRS